MDGTIPVTGYDLYGCRAAHRVEIEGMVKRLATLFAVSSLVICFALAPAPAAIAQIIFDPNAYKALADADSVATILPGTKITAANWQQYKQFMPLWMQAAYHGGYHWHVEAGKPEYTIDVAAASHYPLPVRFVEDTAKYGGQAKLQETASGGYNWSGYAAGLAFPAPSEPNLGVKILYNTWADFRPIVSHFWSFLFLVDRYGNVSTESSNSAVYRLSHLSEPGQPLNLPFAKGLFYSTRFLLELPEQVKYTTELTLQYDDPTRVEEVYVFLPTLRRSLRLSSAARCAPLLGTDYIQDDSSWLPANFEVSVLGKKKVLLAIADPATAYDLDSYVRPPAAFPGWMKPASGKWELRTFYILDLKWLVALGPYCYSHRVFYVDAETWSRPPIVESYDRDGKFWKAFLVVQVPVHFRGQVTLIDPASAVAGMEMDFENAHLSTGVNTPATVDDAVPGEFKDIEEMTSPGSLARILR